MGIWFFTFDLENGSGGRWQMENYGVFLIFAIIENGGWTTEMGMLDKTGWFSSQYDDWGVLQQLEFEPT